MAKWFSVLIVLIAGYVFWRHQRKNSTRSSISKQSHPSQESQNRIVMLPCAHCGLHLPQTDMVQGRQAAYCSTAHQQQAEA